jgi:hypothetical protein
MGKTPKDIIAEEFGAKPEELHEWDGVERRVADKPKRQLMVRITSGEHKGLFVGTRIDGDGCLIRALDYKGDAVLALGPEEVLILHKNLGMSFFEGAPGIIGTQKVQTNIKALGYESELVEEGPEHIQARETIMQDLIARIKKTQPEN